MPANQGLWGVPVAAGITLIYHNNPQASVGGLSSRSVDVIEVHVVPPYILE